MSILSESYSVKAILSAADKGFTSVMKSAKSSLDNLKNTVTSGLNFGIMMAAGQKAFDVISGGVTGLIGDMNDASAAWKTFQGNMEMNGKTADEIKSIKKELQDFAEATIYSSSDMASTFAQLEAVGTKNTTKLVKGFGGLAAAAEKPTQAMKTLSQQATQMAAKPTIAWEDFKLMVEQTPAGIAAVAKQMGMSTQEMIRNVQDGQIATEDFFNAIAEVGTNDAFTKLATEYKTVDQAMSGLKETLSNKLQPAFDSLSSVGIDAISKIIDKVSALDGDAIAAALSIDNLKAAAMDLGVVLGGAAVAFGGNDIFGAISGSEALHGSITQLSGTISSVVPKIKNGFSGISFKSLEKQVDGVKNKFNKMKNSAFSFGDDVKKSFSVLGNSISSAGSRIKSSLDSTFNGTIVEKFSKNLKSGANSVFSGLKKIGNNAGKALTPVKTQFHGLFSYMGSVLQERKNEMSSIFAQTTTALQNFGSKASTVLKPLGTVFSTAFSGIGTGIQKTAGVGVAAMNGMVASLTKIMDIAMASLGPAAILGVVLAGIGVLNSQFGDQINGMIQTVQTQGPQIIDSLVNSITSKLPGMIASGAEVVSNFLNAITANLPSVIGGGIQIISALVQGVGNNVGVLLPAAVNLVTTFVGGILTALPQLLLTGMQFLQSLSQGILDNMGLITESASNIIMGFTNSVTSNLPGILQAGMQILTNLAQGAIQMLPQLIVVGILAISTLITGISNNLPQIMQKGVELVQMLVQGIVQNLPFILSAALQATQSFLTGVVQNLPTIISSGAQIVLSLITGLIQMLPSIVTAGWELIKSLGSAIAEAIPNIITSAVEGIKTIFTGLWDFITGKNKESSKETASDLANMTENVKSNMNTMGTNVSSSMSAMNANASSSADSLNSNVSKTMSSLKTDTISMMGKMTSNVETSFASMNSTANSEASNMMSGVTDSLAGMNSLGSADMSGLADNIIQSAGNANTSASSNISDMASNVDASMKNIGSSVTDGMDLALDSTKKTMTDMEQVVNATLTKLPTLAGNAMSNFNNALRSGGNTANSIAQSMATSIVSVLQSAQGGAYSSGVYIGQGLANGMRAMLGTVRSVAAQLAAAADAAIRAKARIHSPSKVSEEDGGYWGQGWVNGILSKVRDAKQAAMELISIPELSSPSLELAYGLAGETAELNSDYDYSRSEQIIIRVPLEIDGREFAYAEAEYIGQELTRRGQLGGYIKGRW